LRRRSARGWCCYGLFEDGRRNYRRLGLLRVFLVPTEPVERQKMSPSRARARPSPPRGRSACCRVVEWAKTCCIVAGTQGTSRPGGSVLRGRGAELRAACSDRAEPLRQPGPGPRLDLPVTRRGLAARRLEVLEPRVALLDQQELVCMAL